MIPADGRYRDLVQNLSSHSPLVRSDAANSIGQLGAAAAVAVPFLIAAAATDSTRRCAKTAAQALRLVDPDAAARAGIG